MCKCDGVLMSVYVQSTHVNVLCQMSCGWWVVGGSVKDTREGWGGE